MMENGNIVQCSYTFLYSEGKLHKTKCSIELINNSVSFYLQIRLPSDTNEHLYSMKKINFESILLFHQTKFLYDEEMFDL